MICRHLLRAKNLVGKHSKRNNVLFVLCCLMITFIMLLWICLSFNHNLTFERMSEAQKLKILARVDMLRVAEAVREMSRVSSVVMVTLVNEAYLPLSFSWLCNTKLMDVHKHVLFLTTDVRTQILFKKFWPTSRSVVLNDLDSTGNENYSRVGYIKLMIKRTETILAILEQNVEVFLFEVDCLWIRNPIPKIKSYKDIDLVATTVHGLNTVAGGFLYMYPTNATKVMWGALTNELLKLLDNVRSLPHNALISETENDQQYLTTLIFSHFAEIRCKFLRNDDFPDGKWYGLSKQKQNKTKPYIINNNWIIGNRRKIERAKKWKHWFIDNNGSCDEQNLRNTVQDFDTLKTSN